jgi:hypothetical protein
MAARVALLVASTLVLFAMVEAVFRLAGVKGHFPSPGVDQIIVAPEGPRDSVPFGFIPFATFRSAYASDPRAYFEAGNRIDHAHNSAGWRDVEHDLAKPVGTFRILGLGDSYLWGQGVRRDDIVLSKLGSKLDGISDGLSVETINTGLSATNTVQHLQLLRVRGLAYSPDLVVRG